MSAVDNLIKNFDELKKTIGKTGLWKNEWDGAQPRGNYEASTEPSFLPSRRYDTEGNAYDYEYAEPGIKQVRRPAQKQRYSGSTMHREVSGREDEMIPEYESSRAHPKMVPSDSRAETTPTVSWGGVGKSYSQRKKELPTSQAAKKEHGSGQGPSAREGSMVYPRKPGSGTGQGNAMGWKNSRFKAPPETTETGKATRGVIENSMLGGAVTFDEYNRPYPIESSESQKIADEDLAKIKTLEAKVSKLIGKVRKATGF